MGVHDAQAREVAIVMIAGGWVFPRSGGEAGKRFLKYQLNSIDSNWNPISF